MYNCTNKLGDLDATYWIFFYYNGVDDYRNLPVAGLNFNPEYYNFNAYMNNWWLQNGCF